MTEKLGDFLFEGWKRDRQGRAAGVDDNRPIGTQFPEVQAHGFAKAALDPVAEVGASERAWSGESDARATGAGLRKIKRGKVSAGVALAGVIDFSEVGGP
jgi:hypothetical protein